MEFDVPTPNGHPPTQALCKCNVAVGDAQDTFPRLTILILVFNAVKIQLEVNLDRIEVEQIVLTPILAMSEVETFYLQAASPRMTHDELAEYVGFS